MPLFNDREIERAVAAMDRRDIMQQRRAFRRACFLLAMVIAVGLIGVAAVLSRVRG